MRVPIDWLRDFVEVKLSKEELAEKLTLAGLEVEEIDGDVLVLEITPNRGDCLSILGIAREVAALENLKLKTENLKPQLKTKNLDKHIEVKIAEPKICPRFTARIIDGIKIGSSPEWLQKRLASYGFRSINNIVDVTNYAMLETGQPLHAFDFDKIKNGLMRIRRAKKDESVITLDGTERKLDDDAIIIEDEEKIYDLAGIMGGLNSEVDGKTETIVLQGAIFDPVSIRRTSKKLNLTTEASYRYERKVDFKGTKRVLERTTELILETAGGKASKIVDIENVKWLPKKISWSPQKDVEKILGIKIKREKILQFLEKLEIKCLWCSNDGQTCQIEIPSYRHDLNLKEDLVEEVARMYGYFRLPKTILSKQKPARQNKQWFIEQKIKDVLAEQGFVEIESYPYLSGKDLENAGFNLKNCLEIENPLSPETQFLRPLLLPSILKQVAKNPWAPEIKMFEIGRVFDKRGEKKQIVLTSTSPLKEFKKSREVNPEILNKFKIRKKIYLYLSDLVDFIKEISLPALFKTDFLKISYRPISSFPPVVFDLAIIVNEKVKEKNIEEVIKKSSPLVYQLELFDIYKGPQLPKGKKSLAYHLTLSSYDHTLKDEQIKNVRRKIVSDLKEKLNASIRGE